MAWTRENFIDGTPYAAVDFNRMILDGIDEAMTKGGGSSVYVKKQSDNLAKSMKSLRTGLETEFCFFGDSVFYAYYKGEGAVEEDCIPDKNTPYSVRYGKMPTRNSITIYDTFMKAMNEVFENKITLKKKVYSGHTIKWAYEDYNASASDFVLLNFGINDALGAHVDGKDPNYKGNVELFLEYYRKVIERELDGGAAVILVTPVKLTSVVGNDDMDDRTLNDVYEQAVYGLGHEYGIPVINGNDMVKNFPIDLSADFCHFEPEGNKAIGYRLASVFIGQSPQNPMEVHSGSYLSVHPQLCNANIVTPAEISHSAMSPNLAYHISSGNLTFPVVRVNEGLEAVVSGAGKVVWSFYCPYDGMVVIPNMWTNDVPNIAVRLDFGAKQGGWANYWRLGLNTTSDTTIDREYTEPTEVVYNSGADMTTWGNGCCNGIHTLTPEKHKAIKITTKGWHTIEVGIKPKEQTRGIDGVQPFSNIPEDFGNGSIKVFGLNFLSLDEYNRLVK